MDHEWTKLRDLLEAEGVLEVEETTDFPEPMTNRVYNITVIRHGKTGLHCTHCRPNRGCNGRKSKPKEDRHKSINRTRITEVV